MQVSTCPTLPPKHLRFMNDKDDAVFMRIGNTWWSRVSAYVKPTKVFDIGCGYGRLAYAMACSGFAGEYVGVDILPRQIQWLQDNFDLPNYRFEHLDIRNDRYNPGGSIEPSEVRLSPGFSPDLVTVFSVFTHMYEADIEAYLREIRGLTHPDSVVYATFFLMSSPHQPFEFSTQLNDHCWFHSEKDPLHAIAYDEEWLMGLFSATGFECVEVLYGHQDATILRPKPAPES